jgi:nitrogen fixation/metabolism regulation signal transduction histidine kinase
MTFRIRHLATRFALLLALAAVVPLIAYGAISIFSLQRATRESVIAGNENVATRAAEEIRRYITTNAEILKALAADLQDTGLTVAQQDRILKNYILQFHDSRAGAFDEAENPIATSRIGKPGVGSRRTPR